MVVSVADIMTLSGEAVFMTHSGAVVFTALIIALFIRLGDTLLGVVVSTALTIITVMVDTTVVTRVIITTLQQV
ncbi:hypothetical protein C0V77_18800 [Emticicia sp. TH156]|nr:hypothetical protein C0V77_18800 [Emticicia sp. TH156]